MDARGNTLLASTVYSYNFVGDDALGVPFYRTAHSPYHSEPLCNKKTQTYLTWAESESDKSAEIDNLYTALDGVSDRVGGAAS